MKSNMPNTKKLSLAPPQLVPRSATAYRPLINYPPSIITSQQIVVLISKGGGRRDEGVVITKSELPGCHSPTCPFGVCVMYPFVDVKSELPGVSFVR